VDCQSIEIILSAHLAYPVSTEYATQVLDKNHTGLISIEQIPFRYSLVLNLLVPSSVVHTFLRTNNTKVITNFLIEKFGNNRTKSGYISIDKQLKPLPIKGYENLTPFNPSKCNNLEGCPVWYRSHFSLIPTLSIIGNVSKSTGILILNGVLQFNRHFSCNKD
jgi:hypothetical protein